MRHAAHIALLSLLPLVGLADPVPGPAPLDGEAGSTRGARDAGAASGSEPHRALELAEEALDEWNPERARTLLEGVRGLLPETTGRLLQLRGRLAHEEGRYADAVELLSRAAEAGRPSPFLELAADSLEVTEGFERAESAHFVIYFPKGKDAILVPYALDALERVRTALEEDLGYVPEGKIRVEVVPDGEALSRVSTLDLEQIRTTGTIAVCKFNKLMVTSPRALLRGYDWLDTLAHEYIHLVISKASRNTVPIWLHEGTAKYLESRWRGEAGLAMSPATLALLGRRVEADDLITFEQMHPSIALLPSQEDAATAFAEVFFAIDLLRKEHGREVLPRLLRLLREGRSDREAIALATGAPFPAFERAWLTHIRSQRFPDQLLPPTEKRVLKEDARAEAQQEEREEERGDDVSFGDFAEIEDLEARKLAHLGELMRERRRHGAAAELLEDAHRRVGDRYPSVSNKLALALLETGGHKQAQRVLEGSLALHPSLASTHRNLGRVHLAAGRWEAARAAYLEALAIDPFDPELHVALTAAHSALDDDALAARTRAAVTTLTGMPSERVADAVATFLSRLGAPSAPGSAPAKAPADPSPAGPEPKSGPKSERG